MMRICTKCHKEKAESDFPAAITITRNGKPYYKRRPRCKDCVNEYARHMRNTNAQSDFFEVNGKRRSRRQLWEKYKLTPEDYIDMYGAQQGVCAICQFAEAVVVDHDHDTGKVRSLLCQHCNVMIGAAREDVSTLSRGITYLEDWDTRY